MNIEIKNGRIIDPKTASTATLRQHESPGGRGPAGFQLNFRIDATGHRLPGLIDLARSTVSAELAAVAGG
jgi:hypothetical protein